MYKRIFNLIQLQFSAIHPEFLSHIRKKFKTKTDNIWQTLNEEKGGIYIFSISFHLSVDISLERGGCGGRR